MNSEAIPPAIFYNLPRSPQHDFRPPPHHQGVRPPSHPPTPTGFDLGIDPALQATSHSPSQSREAPPAPNTSEEDPVSQAGAKSKRKARQEFTGRDIDLLLRAVIEVNPYIATRSQVSAKWQDVCKRVQENGACAGRDPDMLKNKVKSLLAWVKKGSNKNTHCPLGREAEKDPANFASISGKLDKIESMQREAALLKETEKTQAEEKAQSARVAGEAMREAMMRRHARNLKRKEIDEQDGEGSGGEESDGDKENSGPSPDSSALPSRSASRNSRTPGPAIKRSRSTNGQLEAQNASILEVQRQLLEQQVHANDLSMKRLESSERNHAALVAVLRDMLTGNVS